MNNTLVELCFEHIKDLQIKDIDYELLDSSVKISDGFVTWCEDQSAEPDFLRDSNYVIAKTMKWKIVLSEQ